MIRYTPRKTYGSLMYPFDPRIAMPVIKEVIPLAVAVVGAVTGGALFAATKTREALGEKDWEALHNNEPRRVDFRLEKLKTQAAISLDTARFASPLDRLIARIGL